jgi:hypothetical protein
MLNSPNFYCFTPIAFYVWVLQLAIAQTFYLLHLKASGKFPHIGLTLTNSPRNRTAQARMRDNDQAA